MVNQRHPWYFCSSEHDFFFKSNGFSFVPKLTKLYRDSLILSYDLIRLLLLFLMQLWFPQTWARHVLLGCWKHPQDQKEILTHLQGVNKDHYKVLLYSAICFWNNFSSKSPLSSHIILMHSRCKFWVSTKEGSKVAITAASEIWKHVTTT